MENRNKANPQGINIKLKSVGFPESTIKNSNQLKNIPVNVKVTQNDPKHKRVQQNLEEVKNSNNKDRGIKIKSRQIKERAKIVTNEKPELIANNKEPQNQLEKKNSVTNLQDLDIVNKEVQKLQEEKTKIKDEMKSLKENRDDLQKKNQEMKEEILKLTEKYTTLQKDKESENIKAEVLKLKEKEKSQSLRIEELNNENLSLKQNKELEKIKADMLKLKEKENSQSLRIEELNNENLNFKELVKDLENKTEELKRLTEQYLKNNSVFSQTLVNKEAEFKQSKEKNENTIKYLEDEVLKLRGTVDQLTNNLNNNDLIRNFENILKNTDSQLEDKKLINNLKLEIQRLRNLETSSDIKVLTNTINENKNLRLMISSGIIFK